MEKNLYQKLIERKKQGKQLEWNNITREELEELFENNTDSMIAELYGVTKSQVKSKRNKWDIKLTNYTMKKLFENLNQNSQERLLDSKNFDTISIALTHYLFRNGPIEDMHSKGQLSQEDMKTLNKFMVNRISGLLNTLDKGEWLKLELLLNIYGLYGRDWDKPVPDTYEIERIYKNRF